MKLVDLRSDTVTHPTPEMRKAMYEAEVGDDVYGDDPNVNKLEELAACISGKESALFVPSGTMGNQLAVFTHIKRGDEVILGEDCHIVEHECGAAAVISGANLRCITTYRHEDNKECTGKPGTMKLEEIEAAIRKEEDLHYPATGLICLENAHSWGTVHPLSYMEKIYILAAKYKIPIHLDGARLFNAAEHLKVKPVEITKYADSVMFCLSKGLCAPIGSMLAGRKEFIKAARKKRKLLGGGMRQAGILAAAGIIALQDMIKRLSEDHENAMLLASLLVEIPGIKLYIKDVDINMVFIDVSATGKNATELSDYLNKAGIKINGGGDKIVRFVTNNGVNRNDIKYTALHVMRFVTGNAN